MLQVEPLEVAAMPTAAQVLQAETAVMYLLDPAGSGGDASGGLRCPWR